jgi:penicillin-binding protein 1C
MRDNWCVGFSRRYTVGVWVGNFDGSPMWSVSGVTGAAPAWLELMNYLHAEEPSAPPAAPPGIVRLGGEWYVAGTEPPEVVPAPAAARPRLESPVSGTIVALDPDIPAGQQSLPFAAASGAGLRFSLNGRDLGPAGAPVDWTPEPGRYTLALVDAAGRSVDRSAFEVRGALASETGAPEPEPADDEGAGDLVP